MVQEPANMPEAGNVSKRAAVRVCGAWVILPLFFLVVGRSLGWSEPPMAAVVAALGLSLGGYIMVLRVFLENGWAGRTIETSAEQDVVSTGPYAVVRHPMYAGIIILLLATPAALGSWWAVLPAVAFIPRRVRHRLIPFLC
jgi:protein-S-isoprenylcysteine O-methyltransferase Ste14